MRRLILVLSLCACSGEGSLHDTDAELPHALDDAAFAFCHQVEPPVSLTEREQDALCPLLDGAQDDACPGLRAACDAPADTDSPLRAASSGCGGESAPSSPRAPSEPSPPPPPPTPQLSGSEAIGQVLRWTVAFAVAALVAGLLFWAARVVMGWLSTDPILTQTERPAPAVVENVAVPAADSLPTAPSGDLLSAARLAIEQERLADAVLLCRGAALKSLGESGALRLHASRTDREYVRSLRRADPDRHQALRTVMRAVEVVRWGGQVVSREQAARALSAAMRILGVVLVLLGLAGADRALAGAPNDYGVDGAAALQDLYEGYGLRTRWRLRSLRTVDADTSVVVLDSGRVHLDESDVEALRDWVELGGVLIIGGAPPTGFPELGAIERGSSESSIRGSRLARDLGLSVPVAFGDGVRAYDGAHGVPWVIVQDGERTLVLVQALKLGAGAVIAVGDRRYLTNVALVAPANEAFLGGLPYAGESFGLYVLPEEPTLELATVGGEAGQSLNNPLASLANARLLPLVLQLLGIVALIGLWRGWPFGPPRDEALEGRIRFAEHAEALGRRFARSRASRHAASSLARLWLARMGPLALQAAAERHGYAAAQARDWVERLQALADDPDGPDQPSDKNLVEELWRITSP